MPDEGAAPVDVSLKSMLAEALGDFKKEAAEQISGANNCTSYTSRRDVDSLKAIHALCKPIKGSLSLLRACAVSVVVVASASLSPCLARPRSRVRRCVVTP